MKRIIPALLLLIAAASLLVSQTSVINTPAHFFGDTTGTGVGTVYINTNQTVSTSGGGLVLDYGASIRSENNDEDDTNAIIGMGVVDGVQDVLELGSNPGLNIFALQGPATVTGAGVGDTILPTQRSICWNDAAGVADSVDVCAKDARDAYAWRSIY